MTMADGTIKQVNPFSGTQVWTVPGRGNRPLDAPMPEVVEIGPEANRDFCAFCTDNYLATPPEKARLTMGGVGYTDDSGAHAGFRITRNTPVDQLFESTPEFRRVANLFEIVSFPYWQDNYGYVPRPDIAAHTDAYLATEAGREHVRGVLAVKLKAAGQPMPETEAEFREAAAGFFTGGHDLIIARRHFVDGADTSDQLASTGTLTVDEHRALIALCADSIEDLYAQIPYARYVAVFQNWLKPAGASFDHLHKQLVAIDERGHQLDQEIELLRHNPNMYNEWAVNYAGYHNLIIAETEHAICFAGFGHRYPTVEVFSKAASGRPWEQTDAERNSMADLLHACHAAMGSRMACNEEWHHQPVDCDVPMPWRVMLKWRVSTLAGFEGGTKINVNTISPDQIRDRMVAAMYRLRDEGKIAPNIAIATEVNVTPNVLMYNPAVRTASPTPVDRYRKHAHESAAHQQAGHSAHHPH